MIREFHLFMKYSKDLLKVNLQLVLIHWIQELEKEFLVKAYEDQEAKLQELIFLKTLQKQQSIIKILILNQEIIQNQSIILSALKNYQKIQ
ncbi:unnamed protein product [Paramecium sonneborni]|uniref:Uncharacterized protein n=1 Tax=Paramecium sonneborni TaxID=65129 RepID=A0A8S1JZP0_9CILI|nr:unnamed protein product [Paramecium sonneborni]